MEQAWIPMKDGMRLAATLYMPEGAKPGEKFPALLDYLPYRKDDATAAGDHPKNAFFARRGYVGARVDIRGFGSSEGRPTDREYSEQEQADGEQVIHWLATAGVRCAKRARRRAIWPRCNVGSLHCGSARSAAPSNESA